MSEQVLQPITNYTEQHTKMQLSINLTEILNKNTALMREAAHEFERSDGSLQQRIKLNQRLIDLMAEALNYGDWESSLLLHNLASDLQAEMDLLQEQRKELLAEAAPAANKLATVTQDQQVIYISLYQVDGYSIKKWAQLLLGLARYNLSRPVYTTEEAVQKALRSRGYPISEAYVTVIIDKSKVRKPENKQTDRWGQELISLSEDAVDYKNILQFVHSKIYYQLLDGALVSTEDLNSIGGA